MMAYSYLEFERPIAELTSKIDDLSGMGSGSGLNIAEEVERLNEKRDRLIEDIYSKASRSQICQLSRHPDRPYILDYVPLIFDD
ncbi:MAG: acetyl-CoA carboxylase carboxyl transferase subunit alpha, partial [Mariprofundus sp.]|nr:acetyl-CoA carboxylase carboxyl transferase subunit alpha [Mariprofundus sp.]